MGGPVRGHCKTASGPRSEPESEPEAPVLVQIRPHGPFPVRTARAHNRGGHARLLERLGAQLTEGPRKGSRKMGPKSGEGVARTLVVVGLPELGVVRTSVQQDLSDAAEPNFQIRALQGRFRSNFGRPLRTSGTCCPPPRSTLNGASPESWRPRRAQSLIDLLSRTPGADPPTAPKASSTSGKPCGNGRLHRRLRRRICGRCHP